MLLLMGGTTGLSELTFFTPEGVITLSPMTAKMAPRRKGTSWRKHRGFLQYNQEEG